MAVDVLEPRIDLLCEEYVLVQAWKKTASYIRYHNWYSDTLELDRAAVNLPSFLGELAERLKAFKHWRSDPLRFVPAPKSQRWHVTKGTNWEPEERTKTATRLRPLAYASLKDQVAATAVMLCLADRVETTQGDPRVSVADVEGRKRVVSYGNRLFCDSNQRQLRHRWGSGRLYRAYFEDYRRFLSRPDVVADAVSVRRGARVVIVHSDLRQFYDRVRPKLLARKINALARPTDDPRFYSLAGRLFNWQWDSKDSEDVAAYKKHAALLDFSRVALPQGLVASGFFANVVLLDFDEALRTAQSHKLAPGIWVEDVCRYVDDLRIVLKIDSHVVLPNLRLVVGKWLQTLLGRHAEGLEVSEDKTEVAGFRSDEHPVVSQSRKMEGIQTAISGGFDAIGGEEVLNAVQGLIRSQQRYSKRHTEEQAWQFSPIPDVRDETVARFAAARFRSTFRSLRPLLPETSDRQVDSERGADGPRPPRTRADLDEDAKTFALGLIENWIKDPSNVRLLRIGLDLWPAKDILQNILSLLRPYTQRRDHSKASRQVAWYCLAEVFRAGATETGFVEDGEALPTDINIDDYRNTLLKEAIRLVSIRASTVPWYVRQQLLLFLAVNNAKRLPFLRVPNSLETQNYLTMFNFLNGERAALTRSDFATLAVLARRSFRGRDTAVRLARRRINAGRLNRIATRDLSFTLEIINSKPDLFEKLSPRTLADLCLTRISAPDGLVAVSDVVLKNYPTSPLRNEITLLQFASKFLAQLARRPQLRAITPLEVYLKLSNSSAITPDVLEVRIIPNQLSTEGSIYHPPDWSPPNERWRFQLGYLLRFILSGREDFTEVVRPPNWKEAIPHYRPARSHWYQRRYGFYSGHSAFGDDWLPISDWTERLLLDLLRWPGCHTSKMVRRGRGSIQNARETIGHRLRELSQKQGPSGTVFMLPVLAPRPAKLSSLRPLRACIVQTAIPTPSDFVSADLTLSKPAIRMRHRNHLSAALAAVERMLTLRETHLKRDGRLDWLILPELSVHPRDVKTHLVPFARKYKTLVLAGLTYEALLQGHPLVNSALWVIPVSWFSLKWRGDVFR